MPAALRAAHTKLSNLRPCCETWKSRTAAASFQRSLKTRRSAAGLRAHRRQREEHSTAGCLHPQLSRWAQRWRSFPTWTCWRAAGERRDGPGAHRVSELRVAQSSQSALLPSLSEETFYGPSCLCLQKVRMGGLGGTVARGRGSVGHSAAALSPQKPRLDSEHTTVDVQVTVRKGRGARSFRRAAVLVVAMTKLLRRPRSRDFADSDLSALLEEVFGRSAALEEEEGWLPGCCCHLLTSCPLQSPSPSSGWRAATPGRPPSATPAHSPSTSSTSTRSASCWSHPPSWWPCTSRGPHPARKVTAPHPCPYPLSLSLPPIPVPTPCLCPYPLFLQHAR